MLTMIRPALSQAANNSRYSVQFGARTATRSWRSRPRPRRALPRRKARAAKSACVTRRPSKITASREGWRSAFLRMMSRRFMGALPVPSLGECAAAVRQRNEGLLARNRGGELVEVPGLLRLFRCLHLEDEDVVDLAAVRAD